MTKAGGVSVRASTIEGIELVEADTARHFARHTHECFGIGLMLGGAQRSASGRGPVEASAGDMITVNPEEVHDGVPLGGTPRRWRILYIAPPVVQAVGLDVGEGRPRHIEFEAPVFADRAISIAFDDAYRALGSAPRSGSLHAEGALVHLLAHVTLPATVRGTMALPLRQAMRARTAIDDEPSADWSLARLAQEADTDRFRLLRAFRRLTGLTPHAYVLQRRIDTARTAIASGIGLAEAAAIAGLADQSHMTRLFTARYGYTPGTYAAAFR